MEFSAWVAKSGRTMSEIAREIGVSRAFVSQMCKGQKSPGRLLSVKIEAITGYRVRPRDWPRSGNGGLEIGRGGGRK